jgi:ADP-ribose pyrophosphatase YjhB (NUDIX family)
MALIDKVLAYITRHNCTQLLVFDHRHSPEAGTQVPAGTVEVAESIEQALWREVQEESGLMKTQLSLIGKLAEYEDAQRGTRRHIYHLITRGALPDTWTQIVAGSGDDSGFIFDFRWVSFDEGFELAANQHAWLSLIQRS